MEPSGQVALDHSLMTDNKLYTTLSSRYLWQSRWYNLRQDELQATNGHQFTYTLVESPGAVWIVPVTRDGQVVLINQYRYTVDAWCFEVPAGNIEPGTDPASAAARELHEEIGGTAGTLVAVTDFFTMNGIGNEVAQVFLARDVTLGEPDREPTENIRLHPVPVATALHMARTGAIKDGPSALALLLCEPLLQNWVKEPLP
jgi:8-oxo-dGTP pyrophosphatase MutT (NUDIX family)